MGGEVILYALIGLALFLAALYFSSGSKAKTSQQQKVQHAKTLLKPLSASAAALRNALGVSKLKLGQNTPLNITIAVDGVIAKKNINSLSPDSDCSALSFINADKVSLVISHLCEFAHVHLLVAATSDEEEAEARQQLEAQVLCLTESSQCPLLRHRVLFYSTLIGKTAMVRQILPDVHIDADASLCAAMSPFVESVIQVTGGATGPPVSGTSSSPSFRFVESLCLEKLLSPA